MSKTNKPYKVTCFATKECGMSNTFYKAPNNRWYKSEEVYLKWYRKRHKNQKVKKPGRTGESYREINDLIANLIGYEENQKFPTIISRKIKELDYYSDDVIIETIKESSDAIKWAFEHKTFKDDLNKCSYMMAIITNKIAEVDRRYKNEQKIKSIQNMIHEVLPIENISIEDTNQENKKGKDLSSFLGDDLWS